MRILVVTQYFSDHFGGLQIVAGEVAKRLAARGADVAWAASALNQYGSTGPIQRIPMGGTNICEEVWGIPYPVWGPCSLLRLWKEVRVCDVLHVHDSLYWGNAFAYLFARMQRKPVVVTQHIAMVPYSNVFCRILMAVAYRTVGRSILGGSAACVFCSANAAAYFRRRVRFRRPPELIANGVCEKTFWPLDDHARGLLRARFGWGEHEMVLLFVGRFVEKKGMAVLEKLARRFRQCRWVFVGAGPRDPLNWGLANVDCVGSMNQKDIAIYYQCADLLILPSVGEGFPLVVQEAMSCGTPVLISRETARAWPAVEKVSFVADLDEENLAAKIAQIAREPDALVQQRQKVARFAQEVRCAGDWDWDVCAEKYRLLFTQVLAMDGLL